MKVDLSNGERLIMKNHEDLAKFLLFVAPKLVTAGITVVGDIPRLVMNDKITAYVKINQKLRQNKMSKVCKELMKQQALDRPPFDDDVPF